MIQRQTASYHHSQGAILVVSLVLLLIMTLVGVAAIDSSQLQSQMARNTLYAQNLYQADLSEIEAQRQELLGLDYLTKVKTAPPLSNPDPDLDGTPGLDVADANTITHDGSDPYELTFVVSYAGKALVSGENWENKGLIFRIDGVALIPDTGSLSDQTQGLKYPAPSGDDS